MLKLNLKSAKKMNSLFVKLMAAFLFLILFMCLFYIISYRIYVGTMEHEMIKKERKELNRIVNSIENYVDSINRDMVRFSMDADLQKLLMKDSFSGYDNEIVRKKCSFYMTDVKHASCIFILSEKADQILTPEGTISKDLFFPQLYKNEMFTEEFWSNELKSGSRTNIYQGSYYTYGNLDHERGFLVPVVFKNKTGDLMVVVLVDMYSLVKSTESNLEGEFYILSDDDKLIYPDNSNRDILKTEIDNNLGYAKAEPGYVMSQSTSRGLKYYVVIRNDQIKKQLSATTVILIIMFFCAFIISMIISLSIVIKVNNPVKKILEMIKKSEYMTDTRAADLKAIQNYVQTLNARNTAYEDDLSTKNSLLRSFFYQARIKNIYSFISQVKEEILANEAYFICYFKVHYKKRYYDQLIFEPSQGTFYLKELIQLYIKGHFSKSVTFNIEDDQIISVINFDKDKNDIRPAIESILMKLKTEEEYAFFTVITGKSHVNISELDTAYNNLIKIQQHRALLGETQWIEEEKFTQYNGKLFFTLEHVKHLHGLMVNGNTEECIQQMGIILDTNYKLGVSAFYIAMICREMVDCCVKCLVEMQFKIPDGIDVEAVYSRINNCAVIEEYKEICFAFVSEVTAYINTHRITRDQIIIRVKEYVENNYSKDFSIDMIASDLNMTRVYLSGYFKNKTGVNLSDYIRNYRMEKAKEMLADSSVKINDVSAAVGLSNVNTFIRLFKIYTGVTPGEFKKNIP